MVGLIIRAVIVTTVVAVIIAGIFHAPRTFRIPALFIGELIISTALILLAFAGFSALLGLIVPG